LWSGSGWLDGGKQRGGAEQHGGAEPRGGRGTTAAVGGGWGRRRWLLNLGEEVVAGGDG
jgi:hypothetical protein